MNNTCQVCLKNKTATWKSKICDDCFGEYTYKRGSALGLLNKAIRKGQIIRPLICELCKDKPTSPKIIFRPSNTWRKRPPLIVGHHYNGYDNPLDVWWICSSCNARLSGPFFHSGKVTKYQAQMAVRSSTYRDNLVKGHIMDYEI